MIRRHAYEVVQPWDEFTRGMAGHCLVRVNGAVYKVVRRAYPGGYWRYLAVEDGEDLTTPRVRFTTTIADLAKMTAPAALAQDPSA